MLAKKPHGKPKGSTRLVQDKILLDFYDRVVASRPDLIKSLPRMVGQMAHENAPGQFGLSANAITTKLRRLLKQRDEAPASHAGSPLDPDWRDK